MTPRISFGFTLNFWQDGLSDNKWKMETHQSRSGTDAGLEYSADTKITDEYVFSGFNANLGILWNVNSNLTLGLVLKTPFTADLTHKATADVEWNFPDNPGSNKSYVSSDETDEELDMPMSYGIGLAYRVSDNLTTSLDIYRTEWDDYLLTDSDGNEISPITGKPVDESNVEPTHQVRAGAEYLCITDTYVIPFRGGIFYDPGPADKEPDDFYGFSLGTGFAKSKYVIDIAYQYRYGNNVGEFMLKGYDYSQDIKEHTIYASIIYHF